MPEVLTKNGPAFGKLCSLDLTETNCGRDLMHFEIEFKLILDEKKSKNTFWKDLMTEIFVKIVKIKFWMI